MKSFIIHILLFLNNENSIICPFNHTIPFTDIDIHDICSYTVASRYLQNLQISSARMTQYMWNIKMAGTNCLTEKYRVPFFATALRDKIVRKYMNRPQRCESL